MTLHFFFSSRRRHTRFDCDWSSDVCSSDLTTSTDGRRRTACEPRYVTARPAFPRAPPARLCPGATAFERARRGVPGSDRKSTRLNSSHSQISYAVFCLKKKKKKIINNRT